MINTCYSFVNSLVMLITKIIIFLLDFLCIYVHSYGLFLLVICIIRKEKKIDGKNVRHQRKNV